MSNRRADVVQKSLLKRSAKGAERPALAERRASQRFALTAMAEIVEVATGTRSKGRVSDLSLTGCYMDMLTPFAQGTFVQLRIKYNAQSVDVKGTVRFSHAGLGMGISFESTEPAQTEMLQTWIELLIGGHKPSIDFSESTPVAPVAFDAPAAASTNRKAVDELTALLVRKGILTQADVSELHARLRPRELPDNPVAVGIDAREYTTEEK